MQIAVSRGGALQLVSGWLTGASALTTDELRTATAALYRRVLGALERSDHPHPIRIWNFIPGIHADMGDGLDRYMVFNSGRHDAMQDWLRSSAHFAERLPTATGVGHRGDGLFVYCLASKTPGQAAENPRQRPAYHYSKRWGPLPPCFARGTVADIDGLPRLLVGGTASVLGEASMHEGDLDKQIDETFINLEALASVGANGSGRVPRFRYLRVYHVESAHVDVLRTRVLERFPGLKRLELTRADLCRRELLVEIEGMACAEARAATSCPEVVHLDFESRAA